MSDKSYTTYKSYIRKFDFAEAQFDKLPLEVFQADVSELSPMDRAILDGIKFQMTVSKYNERYQKVKYNIKSQISNLKSFRFVITNTAHNITPLGQCRTSSFVFDTEIRLIRNFVAIPLFLFLLISLTYYANVNLHLGMTFLTNMFA